MEGVEWMGGWMDEPDGWNARIDSSISLKCSMDGMQQKYVSLTLYIVQNKLHR